MKCYLYPANVCYLYRTPLPLYKNLGKKTITVRVEQEPAKMYPTAEMLEDKHYEWLDTVGVKVFYPPASPRRKIPKKYVLPYLVQYRGVWNKTLNTGQDTVCCGTITDVNSPDAETILIDDNATFISSGVLTGDTVTLAESPDSLGTVVRVDSETELTTTALDYDAAEAYTISRVMTKYKFYPYKPWNYHDEVTPREKIYGRGYMSIRSADWNSTYPKESTGHNAVANDYWYATRAFKQTLDIYSDDRHLESIETTSDESIVEHYGWNSLLGTCNTIIGELSTSFYPDEYPTEACYVRANPLRQNPMYPEIMGKAFESWSNSYLGTDYDVTVDGDCIMTATVSSYGHKPLRLSFNVEQDEVLLPADVGILDAQADFYDYGLYNGGFDKDNSPIEKLCTLDNNATWLHRTITWAWKRWTGSRFAGAVLAAIYGTATEYALGVSARYLAAPLCLLSRQSQGQTHKHMSWHYDVTSKGTFADKTLAHVSGFFETWTKRANLLDPDDYIFYYYGGIQNPLLFGVDKWHDEGSIEYCPVSSQLGLRSTITVTDADLLPLVEIPTQIRDMVNAVQNRTHLEKLYSAPRIKISIHVEYTDESEVVTDEVDKFYYIDLPFEWHRQNASYDFADYLSGTFPSWVDEFTHTNCTYTVLERNSTDKFSWGRIGSGEVSFDIVVNNEGVAIQKTGGDLGEIYEADDTYIFNAETEQTYREWIDDNEV